MTFGLGVAINAPPEIVVLSGAMGAGAKTLFEDSFNTPDMGRGEKPVTGPGAIPPAAPGANPVTALGVNPTTVPAGGTTTVGGDTGGAPVFCAKLVEPTKPRNVIVTKIRFIKPRKKFGLHCVVVKRGRFTGS